MRNRVALLMLVSVPVLFSRAQAADPPARPPVTRVAVYDDVGSSKSRETLIKKLAGRPELRVERIKAEDIRAGRLADFQVLIQPGGSGSAQARALEEKGREQIRKFVSDGGGYIGICAGAYLASADYAWSLHILNARVVDKKHWARGVADLRIGLTARGRHLLARPDERLTIRYHQGPLLAPADQDDLPDYEELARFEEEVAKNGAPKGVMIGTTAIAASRFGRGRVLCFSPHPELTEGLQDLLYHGAAWVANVDRKTVPER